MQIERTDYEYGTEIIIGSACARDGYTVICSDIGRDHTPPTVHVHLPRFRTLDPADVRRLARELDYVADVAEALQAEKRAAYASKAAPETH